MPITLDPVAARALLDRGYCGRLATVGPGGAPPEGEDQQPHQPGDSGGMYL